MLEAIGLPCMASVVSSGVLTSAKVWQRTPAVYWTRHQSSLLGPRGPDAGLEPD